MLKELCTSNMKWIVSNYIRYCLLSLKNALQNLGRPLIKSWVCSFCGLISNHQQCESWEMKALEFYQVNYILAKLSQGWLKFTLLLCYWTDSAFKLMKTKKRIFLGKFPKFCASVDLCNNATTILTICFLSIFLITFQSLL